ncbi:hypothetical protein A5320_02295 [Rheinheimera sp. SA_1]|nr:hypothetical protein A5320_02295 [Rheinheimera sp. SA_1]
MCRLSIYFATHFENDLKARREQPALLHYAPTYFYLIDLIPAWIISQNTAAFAPNLKFGVWFFKNIPAKRYFFGAWRRRFLVTIFVLTALKNCC